MFVDFVAEVGFPSAGLLSSLLGPVTAAAAAAAAAAFEALPSSHVKLTFETAS